MKPNYWLCLSSLSYCFPCVMCFRLGHPYLAGVYGLVVTASTSYHATKYPIILYIDIPLAHLAHGLTLYKIVIGGLKSMIPYSFWLTYTVITYYHGYKTNSLIWNPDVQKATPWHAGMHILTSFFTCLTMWLAYSN